MDNNQQTKDGGTQQPATKASVTEQAGPQAAVKAPTVTNLGVNNPTAGTTKAGFTSNDVSMTTPQKAGGNITTTEAGSI